MCGIWLDSQQEGGRKQLEAFEMWFYRRIINISYVEKFQINKYQQGLQVK